MPPQEQKWSSDKVKYWFAITTLVDRALVSQFPRQNGWDGWACDLFCYLLVEKKQKLDYHKTHMQQDKNSISVKKQDEINHAESEESI